MLRHLDTALPIVSSFEVVELYPSHLFANGTISAALPASVSVEVGLNRRILPERILLIRLIVDHRPAWVSSWLHGMEDSQSISSHGMSSIVLEVTHSLILWANISVRRWSHCMQLKIVPDSISIRSTDMVSNKMVIWMSDPKSCWRVISVEKTPRSFHDHYEVVCTVVVGLDRILDEEDMAGRLINCVVCKPQVMSSVHGESSVVTLMNSIAVSVGSVDCTNHMEMDSVSSEFERLPHISELGVAQSSGQRVVALRVQEESRSILVRARGFRVSSKSDISREKTYFSSCVNGFIAVFLNHREMFVVEWSINGNCSSIRAHCGDESMLSLPRIEARWCHTNLLSNLPINLLG